jgi:hypothetical protein
LRHTVRFFGRVGGVGIRVDEGNTVIGFLFVKALVLENFMFNPMVPIAAV